MQGARPLAVFGAPERENSREGTVMPNQLLIFGFGVGAIGLAMFATLAATLFTVEQRTVAMIQRHGRFLREAGPGFH
jgi:hypothetical protein